MSYLNHLKLKNYSLKSIDIYGRSLKILVKHLNETGVLRVQDVTYDHLERFQLFLFNRNYAASSVDIFLRAAHGFFRYLTKAGCLFLNPAMDLILPHYVRKLQIVPSPEDVRRLLAAIDLSTKRGLRDSAFFTTAYSCGLRLSELTSLTLSSPDFKCGELKVTGKGRKERVVPISKKAKSALLSYLENARPYLQKEKETPAFFLSVNTGKPLCASRIPQIARGYSKKAGITPPISIQALRRACVSHMLKNGAHPLMVKELLGHSSTKTLSQYLKVNASDLILMQKKARTGK